MKIEYIKECIGCGADISHYSGLEATDYCDPCVLAQIEELAYAE